MSYLSAFTNQMEAFASELSSMFPEDVDLKTALNMIKMIKKVNPRKLLSVFEKFTSGYKDQIMSKDERFFIDHDFNDLANKIKFYKNNNTLRKRIARGGKKKYFKLFNELKISKYIIEKSLGNSISLY